MIAVVKDELLGEWQQQLPDDIPNYFLINIRSEDVGGIEKLLQSRGIEASPPYALVRARLAQINGIDADQYEFSDPRASNTINHTFNISYTDTLPEQNRIVSGQWLSESDNPAQFSVEEGMAQRLELELGDTLTMTVGSRVFTAEVTSIRSVEWENFKPNFFLIANASLVESYPQTWLLSALIRENDRAGLKQLLQQYPSVTLLDISEIMARVRAIVDRASVALQFFFVFALVSALVVLMAAIQTGKKEREIESSLLRALSAQQRGFDFTLLFAGLNRGH